MIGLPREEAEIDVFGTGLCAFYCWAGWGGVDGQEIKDISPLGLCLLLHHQQFLQKKATPGAANPRQDSRDIFQ